MEEDPKITLFKEYPFMALARKSSLKSTYRHALGAVLTNKKSVLSIGYNKLGYKKRGNSFRAWDNSVHAEVDCLTKIDKDKIVNSTIYIYRELKNGKPALSYPCSNCLSIMKFLKVKRVIYSIDTYPYYGILKLGKGD